jgi:Sensors of blue-light using FAD
MLVRMLYASRSKESITPASVDAILNKCRVKNPASGISGVLCYSGDVYLQVLEGGRQAVNALYTKILQDPRHTEITILHYEEVKQRNYGSWTMGKVNLEKLNPALLLKYSEKPILDPFGVSGEVSNAFLQELISTASVNARES